jgi:hypothetical protein
MGKLHYGHKKGKKDQKTKCHFDDRLAVSAVWVNSCHRQYPLWSLPKDCSQPHVTPGLVFESVKLQRRYQTWQLEVFYKRSHFQMVGQR